MKQFTIIKREDNGKDINEMGLCPFYFSLQNNKKIHVKAVYNFEIFIY